VRHIPEDELHAYLDQALSRSQGVEIERHLARCSRCRAERDTIAALRDRTTDLLAGLGSPGLIVPPPYAELLARRAAGRSRPGRWAWRSIAAAGLAGALLAGHGTWPSAPNDGAAVPVALATDPVLQETPPPPTAPEASPPTRPDVAPVSRTSPATPRRESRQLVRRAAVTEASAEQVASAIETDPGTWFAGVAAEPAPRTEEFTGESEVSVVPVGNLDPGLAGLWRTVSLDRSGSGAGVPLVPGAAVLRMRMQPGDDGAEVVAVDQQLESGELIRTISGPARRVAELVGDDGSRDPGGRVTVTIRQADRMVAVTGPSDVLGSLLSRVNTRRRY